MGSMTDEEYTTKLLELLRYVPYIKNEKAKVDIFVSGLPLAFRDRIEYDEPGSLVEVIGKLKHFYEKSKCKTESQQGCKGKDKAKDKWQPKRKRPQDAGENKMLHLIRSLMDLSFEKIKIKVMVSDGCGVGNLLRIILRMIVHRKRVVDLICIVHKKQRMLGMLGK